MSLFLCSYPPQAYKWISDRLLPSNLDQEEFTPLPFDLYPDEVERDG